MSVVRDGVGSSDMSVAERKLAGEEERRTGRKGITGTVPVDGAP